GLPGIWTSKSPAVLRAGAPMGGHVSNFESFYVGGKWVAPLGREIAAVVNPCTEEVIAQITLGSVEDADRAVSAARDAFASWSATSPMERAGYLQAISEALEARQDEIGETIARELGMPLRRARAIQAGSPIAIFRSYVEVTKEYAFEAGDGA